MADQFVPSHPSLSDKANRPDKPDRQAGAPPSSSRSLPSLPPKRSMAPPHDRAPSRGAEASETLVATPSVLVTPWEDPVISQHGYDPRSEYAETYWLGVLGPSTTWLLRYLATTLESQPEGAIIDLRECATALGLGNKGGHHSPFMRSIRRAIQFGLARELGPGQLQVRTHLPPLTRGQLTRLSPTRQQQHQQHLEAALQKP